MSTTQSSQASPIEVSSMGSSDSSASLSILIADKFDASGVKALEDAGCRVTSSPDLSGESLESAIRESNPDVLIVRSTKVPKTTIDAADRLSLIVRAGAGYDTIDVEAASARGVFVANCPGKNAVAVAELAWGLILSCDRRIPAQCADLKANTWKKKEYAKARGLYGRTIGIVGLGTIGLEVAERARAFGMRVIGWSRSLTEEKADALGIGFCSNLVNLAKMADVVSIHVASNADTKQLIDAQFINAMQDGAYLINTSRGAVVDQEALVEAMRSKGIRAGLDVYADEPGSGDPTFDHPITQEVNLVGTHHIGASTDQAQAAIADEAVRVVQAYADSGQVPNCVNRAAKTKATSILTVRHLNRPGVLAHVFYTLGQAGINVEEMENLIYEGEEAACAHIHLSELIAERDMQAIATNDHVLSISLKRIQD